MGNMNLFSQKLADFFVDFGSARHVTLVTSVAEKVSARTVSVVLLVDKFYFQTDIKLPKYAQLIANPNVALCVNDMQIQGVCTELGKPSDFPDFITAYRAGFPDAYKRYTNLPDERVFAVTPTYIERWRYLAGDPYIETFDCVLLINILYGNIRGCSYKITIFYYVW